MEKKQQDIQHRRNESKSTNCTSEKPDQPLYPEVTPVDLLRHGITFYPRRPIDSFFSITNFKVDTQEERMKYGINDKDGYTHVCCVMPEKLRLRDDLSPQYIASIPYRHKDYKENPKKTYDRKYTFTGPNIQEALDIIKKDKAVQQKVAAILTLKYQESNGKYGDNLIKNMDEKKLRELALSEIIVYPDGQKNEKTSERQNQRMLLRDRERENSNVNFLNDNLYNNYENNIKENNNDKNNMITNKINNSNYSNIINNQTTTNNRLEPDESYSSSINNYNQNQHNKSKTYGCCCNCIFTCCPGGKCSCCKEAKVGCLEANIASNNKVLADNNVLANNKIANKMANKKANKNLGAKKKEKKDDLSEKGSNCSIF